MKDQALRDLERRFKLFSALIFIIFAVLLSRLWYLQIIKGEETYTLSRQNQTREIRINAPRGNIYDRNRRPLVTSRMSHVVSVVPEDVKNHPEVLDFLSRVLKIPVKEIKAKLEEKAGYKKDQYIPIKHDVAPVAVGQILEAKLDLPGVVVEKYPVRNYPLGEWGAHIFGYIGEINEEELKSKRHLGYRLGDLVGQMGLEKTYETYLRGTAGVRLVEVNRVAQPLKILEERNYSPGNNLLLTIDYKLQNDAERFLREQLLKLQENPKSKNARSGAVLAMDPRNGEILALVSYPAFDPNLFVGSVSGKTLSELFADPLHPFNNRVTRGGFMPGSTFKPITIIGALEEGLTDRNDKFYCAGVTRIGNAEFKCDKREGHGWQTLVEAIQNSCNIAIGELGRRLGPEGIAKYAHLFGLGSPTGLDLNPEEISGIVGDPEWKRKTKGQIWYPMETLHLSVGQGFITVTPIQLAQVYAAIANGGKLYKPHLVSRIESVNGETVKEFPPQILKEIKMKPSNLALLREGLKKVISHGTARYAFMGFPLDKLPVAGKTGTAQNQGKDNFAFFASYAPADNPELVIVVVVEEGGYGSVAAAPIARRLFESYFGIKSAPIASLPAPSQEELEDEEISRQLTKEEIKLQTDTETAESEPKPEILPQ